MPQQPAYRFGEFLLDPALRELRRGEAEVSLPSKSFECLVYLLEHRDRAVGRDELISAVWGRVDVSDALLAQTLLRARRAVGDTGSEQTTFRTIPRFGYRWVAPVSLESRAPTHADGPATSPVAAAGDIEADAPFATSAPSSAPAPWKRMRPAWIAGAIAMVLVALSFRYFGASRVDERVPAVPGTQSDLAMVLPVAMASTANPEQAWVRLGAMDYISSRLRGNGGMSVVPSSQVLQLVDESATKDPAALARRLQATTGAQWVVRPSVISGRNGWVVRLQVVAGSKQGNLDVEARGSTALAAAAAATDSLLRRLGRLHGGVAQAPDALAERLQQIDAELLAGQLANARALVQGAAPDLRNEPELRLRDGQVEFRAGRIEQAVAIFERLLADRAPMPEGVRAQASMGLGATAIRSGDFQAAERRYGDAVDMLSRNETLDPSLLGNAYNGRGIARLELGNDAEAIADIGRARLAMQRAGNDLEVASVDTNLGMLESRRGNDTRAIQQFDRAIATFERFGVTDNLAAVLQAKAGAQMRLAQPAAALATIELASAKLQRIENPLLRERVGLVRARVYIANGRLDAAATAIAALGDASKPQSMPAIDALRLRLALNRGTDREAVDLVRSLAAREDPDAETILLAVQTALRAGDPALARAWLAKAGPTAREEAAWSLAQALVTARDGSGTEVAFASAEAAALRETNPDLRIAAGCAHAAHLIAKGDTDRAGAILGEVATLADNDYRIAHTTLALYRALGQADAVQASAQAVRRLAGQRDPARPLVY